MRVSLCNYVGLSTGTLGEERFGIPVTGVSGGCKIHKVGHRN